VSASSDKAKNIYRSAYMSVTSYRKYGNKVVPKLLEKVDILSIVDNVSEGGTNLPLSAQQGKLLNQAINNEAAARIQGMIDLKDGVGTSYNTLKKLQTAIEAEVSGRTTALSTETSLREAAIVAEHERAVAAETAISQAITNSGGSTSAEVSALKADMQSADSALQTLINTETSRATNAEAVLQSAIDAEVISRNAAVAEVSTNLATETQNRTNQDTATSSRIGLLETAVASGIIWKQSFESVTAMASALVESSVMGGWSYYISTEKDVYVVVDGVDGDYKPESWTTKSFVKIADFNEISQLVQGEKIRAVAAEAQLQANLDAEVANRTAADLALSQNLTNEAKRASNAETAISNALISAIQTLNDAISSESTSRANGDSAISNDIATKYTEVKSLIESEKSRAQSAEGALQDAIGGVISDMGNREVAMDSRMDVIEGDESVNGSVRKSLFDAKAYADSMVLRPRTVGRDGLTVVIGDQFNLPLVPAEGVNGILYGEVIVYTGNGEAVSVQVANVSNTSVALTVGTTGEYDGNSVVCHFFYRNIDQTGAGSGGAGSGGAGA
jgi:hypothetical protein